MLFEYVPHQNGRPVPLPVALQSFDRYNDVCPDWSTEAGQLRGGEATHEIGCDTHWFDAAWFEGGFPNGVGNWFCPPQRFPHGLKPVSDACHQMGLKFILWFEPERVAARHADRARASGVRLWRHQRRPLQVQRPGRAPLADRPACPAASPSSGSMSIATISTSIRSVSGGGPTPRTARA